MKKVLLSLLFLAFAVVYADNFEGFEASATNTLKFGSGTEWAGQQKDIELDKRYLENWLDVELSKGQFTIGFRIEATDPSEYEEKITDITKKYIRFSKDNLTLTAGDFYGIFGRGMVLDLREEKANFLDSRVFGGKAEYEHDYFMFQALGGKSHYKYENDFDPTNQTVEAFDNSLLGADGQIYLSDIFESNNISYSVGGSYLFMEGYEDTPSNQYLYDEMYIKKTEIGGVNFSASYEGFDFYNEYAVKTTFRDPVKRGWANYTSLSYGAKGFALTLEYKDYYRFGANPNLLESPFTPYQNPAQVVIDHTSHLLKTIPHVVNANDEVGIMAQFRTTAIDNVVYNAIFAVSSLHDGDSPAPSMDEKFLPYYDFWNDISYDFGVVNAIAGAGFYHDSPQSKNQEYILDETDPELVYNDERVTGMLELEYEIDDDSSIKVAGEYQTVTHRVQGEDEEWEDMYGSIEYSYPEYGYINMSMITTTEDVPEDTPDNWFGIEGGYNISDSHKLELFYGRERAGIKCSGGVCRQVPEFDGFKLTLISVF